MCDYSFSFVVQDFFSNLLKERFNLFDLRISSIHRERRCKRLEQSKTVAEGEMTVRREAEIRGERRKWKRSDERRWVRTPPPSPPLPSPPLITDLPWLWLMALVISELTPVMCADGVRWHSSPNHICLPPTPTPTYQLDHSLHSPSKVRTFSNSKACFIVATLFWSWA